jgi:hypothetical protein
MTTKTVPVEPTEEMINSICSAHTECKWPDDFGDTARAIRRVQARRGYKAALASALAERDAESAATGKDSQESASSSMAWLIERGINERQSPTIWWRGATKPKSGMPYLGQWTENANWAFRLASRESAEKWAVEQNVPIPYSITQHTWLGSPESAAPLIDSAVGLTCAEIDELQITLLRLAIKLGNDELEEKFAKLCALAKRALSAPAMQDCGELVKRDVLNYRFLLQCIYLSDLSDKNHICTDIEYDGDPDNEPAIGDYHDCITRTAIAEDK